MKGVLLSKQPKENSNPLPIQRKFLIKGFFINIDRCINRRITLTVQLEKTIIKVKRWKGVDGKTIQGNKHLSPGELACLRSHRTLLEHALKEDIEFLLIMEDDVELKDGFDYLLSDSLRELPKNFDALYLGGNEVRPSITHSMNLKRVQMMTGGFGVIFRNTIFTKLIDKMKSESMIADHCYMAEQKTSKMFKTFNDIILHKKGCFSEIHQKIVTY